MAAAGEVVEAQGEVAKGVLTVGAGLDLFLGVVEGQPLAGGVVIGEGVDVGGAWPC